MDKKRDELANIAVEKWFKDNNWVATEGKVIPAKAMYKKAWDACKQEMEKTHVPLSEVQKLVEALKFYKNENNYNLGKIGRWNKTDCGDYFTNDYGQTANKALEQFNAKYGEKR